MTLLGSQMYLHLEEGLDDSKPWKEYAFDTRTKQWLKSTSISNSVNKIFESYIYIDEQGG